MRLICYLVISLTISHWSFSQSHQLSQLIPQPVSVQEQPGQLVLSREVGIQVPVGDTVLYRMAEDFANRLIHIGIKSKITGSAPQGNIPGFIFKITPFGVDRKEAYKLSISNKGVLLTANQHNGIFYGIQTLLQLLPPDIESTQERLFAKVTLPYAEIFDYPRFGWRGLMLDVSRHFFTKAEVKRFIDDMVKYKFNILHWHLTDDQGWRIEIKSYPRLTEVGAWRVDKTGAFGTFSAPEPGEPKTYGGYYTQEDIKEIVAYAQARYVNIVPEVDVPGHSLAAIAAYPWLTCTPGEYAVNSGERFMVWPGGGQHFYGLLDNALCPANEEVYTFLDKVFTEVAQLFPFEYIHIGGDETARNFWEKSESIQQLMKEKQLKDLDEVQSYFVKRVSKIVQSKGKKIIGWDEIMQGGLPEGATVMSWQGMKGGIKASQLGHDVIMTPTDFVYLDYMQSEPLLEPRVYASLRLKKTYNFDPQPDSAVAARIKGGQGNLWTEQVYNLRQVQYMVWPRAMAIAEILWSPKGARDFNAFVKRIEAHFERLNAAQTKYAPSMYDPDFKAAKTSDNKLQVTLVPEIEGLTLYYSFDNSLPDNFYPAYTHPLIVPKDASQMRVISYRNGKPLGRMLTMPVEELKKRAGIK